MSENILSRRKLSVKVQALAGLIAVVSAVALPQLFHVMGAVSGLGTALGETFLPMHLPIILAGLLCGPYAAAAAGAAAPLISFLLTGMPNVVMLPFMCVELFVYGLAAGLMRNAKLPSIAKVIIAQIAGRGVRALAIVIGANVFGSAINVSVIWTSIAAGIFGIALQWALIPLIVYRAKNAD
ncbi:MAG: ECF transporter S component [Oscillospiraceae bacterium]|nr:ECF transporter S component [Oscillospiraceae bacterium]